MLNISRIKISDSLPFDESKSLIMTLPLKESRRNIRLLSGLLIVAFVMLFLPWTQNIRSKVYVTALRPDHRPQTIHSIFAGRIGAWYVAEGDFGSKGDTILNISEVKDGYFDSLLLPRTQMQVDAKSPSAKSYGGTVEALQDQIADLEKNNILRIQQAENKLRMAELKVQSDSIGWEQSKVNFD